MPRSLAAAGLTILMLAGCVPAETYMPMLDTSRPLPAERSYRRDLAQCREVADAASPAEAAGIVPFLGVTVGAGIGAVVASSPAAGTIYGSLAGGVPGLFLGEMPAAERQIAALEGCMRERGYAVVADPNPGFLKQLF